MKRFTLLIAVSTILLMGCSPKSDKPLPTKNEKPMPATALNLQVIGYEDGGRMPTKFATAEAGGENVSIGVKWTTLPAAQSYALMLHDKHPIANNWIHWLVVDIENIYNEITEGASGKKMPAGSRELTTTWGKSGYGGPQPPVGSANHEYVATLYALDVPILNIEDGASRAEFLEEVDKHTILKETYTGVFDR